MDVIFVTNALEGEQLTNVLETDQRVSLHMHALSLIRVGQFLARWLDITYMQKVNIRNIYVPTHNLEKSFDRVSGRIAKFLSLVSLRK